MWPLNISDFPPPTPSQSPTTFGRPPRRPPSLHLQAHVLELVANALAHRPFFARGARDRDEVDGQGGRGAPRRRPRRVPELSLEFNAGGSDVRIGIWARQNSHRTIRPGRSGALTIVSELPCRRGCALQRVPEVPALPGRPRAVAHYNAAKVFPYPLIDPAVEDNFYKATGAAAAPALNASTICCIQDVGTTSSTWPLNIFRFYAWGAGGGANQTEFRWSYLLNFLTRGMTGRYLNAAHFYRFQAESAFPHSDGFNWRDQTGQYDGFGFPSTTSANSSLSFRNWKDQEHGHWYGMTDYYFLTGDEAIKEALLDGPKDWFLNPNTYQNGVAGGLFNTRSIAGQLIGAARFSKFLAAIGDPDAAGVLAQGTNAYNAQVKPELCVSGYPVGCVLGPVDGGPWTTEG